jgi:hypothetical protein
MKKLTQLQQLDISSSEESRDTTTLEETSSTATPKSAHGVELELGVERA